MGFLFKDHAETSGRVEEYVKWGWEKCWVGARQTISGFANLTIILLSEESARGEKGRSWDKSLSIATKPPTAG